MFLTVSKQVLFLTNRVCVKSVQNPLGSVLTSSYVYREPVPRDALKVKYEAGFSFQYHCECISTVVMCFSSV